MAVKVGMTRAEVVKLLGEPPRDRILMAPPYVKYGWLQFRSVPNARGYSFCIGFDSNDKVFLKSDPFNGRFALDGNPSKPELIIPKSGARFQHFPRILDVRWNPCSGVYPMKYTIEIGLCVPRTSEFHSYLHHKEIDEPYAALELPGSQPARVRVRAKNEIATGEWSDYRLFDFSIS
jgi:hypothetical protein